MADIVACRSHPASRNIRETGVLLRLATPADAVQAQNLFAGHLRSMGVIPDPELDADMVDFPVAYQAPGAAFCVAVTAAGMLAGMGGLKDGVVRRLHVILACRGEGLAGRILAFLLAQAPGGRTISCIVATGNMAAKKVFLRSGFRPSGKIPDHPKMSSCEILEYQKLC